MRNRLSLIPLLLTLLVAFAGAPAAAQADYRDIFTDCNDGTIDGTYSAKEFQQALRNLDAYTGDYSECADAIFLAQQNQASGTKTGGSKTGGGTAGGSTSTGGGTTGTTPGTAATGGTTTTPGTTTGSAPTTTTPDPQNDARDADAAERSAALAAATASADKQAQKTAADLKNTGVPAAALQLGEAETSLPGPLLLTLIACAAAAVIAGGATGFQAYRRRRGR
ncbi:hypothetical protein [Patulibacter sp.]|uniref:hypothetical protein n=1 Tax=Patulibacter sp. TaxID=1912859 RepID=UPI00271CA0F5|nr:hypothetical protein [Patulibacter sp.]MDO9409286.1 hypothetical protein [Patulibacter sp.]